MQNFLSMYSEGTMSRVVTNAKKHWLEIIFFGTPCISILLHFFVKVTTFSFLETLADNLRIAWILFAIATLPKIGSKSLKHWALITVYYPTIFPLVLLIDETDPNAGLLILYIWMFWPIFLFILLIAFVMKKKGVQLQKKTQG